MYKKKNTFCSCFCTIIKLSLCNLSHPGYFRALVRSKVGWAFTIAVCALYICAQVKAQ